MTRQQNWSQSISFVNSQAHSPFARDQQRSRKPARKEAEEGPGLMASPAFWLGGAFSLGFWTLMVLVLRDLF